MSTEGDDTVQSMASNSQPKYAKFKIGLCQLRVTNDKDENIARARKAIEDAAAKGASLVLLPEVWNCPISNETFLQYAEEINSHGTLSPSISMLCEVASRLGITIIGGSIPELSYGQLFNTCCVIGSDGMLKAKHRKLHLFDINIPGDITFRESDTFVAGQEATVVDTDFGRIGIGICHDIRFPELAIMYRSKGVHLICYPGAFNVSTGESLWELMQRARAVDNQVFVATCSPARNSDLSYAIWGHSSLIGPFGEVIATAGHEETTVIAEVDYSLIHLRRESLPLEMQRRGDIYKTINVQGL